MNGDSERPGGERVTAVLWAGKYLIVAAVIVMVALAFVYTASEQKVYQATAIIQVNVATNQPASTDTTNTNQALAQNYATLLVSPGLLGTIRSQVDGGKLSVAGLQSRLTVSALANSSLVQLQATGDSTGEAQAIAQQVAEGFLAQLRSSAASRTAQLQSQDEQTISSLSSEIAKLRSAPANVANSQQLTSLKASLQALITQNEALVASGLAQGTSATLTAPAVAAPDPISPRRSLNVLGGLILGLVLGVALAFLRRRLKPATMRTAEAATDAVKWPVLVSIPLRSKLRGEDPSVLEAYRMLATRLSIPMRDRGQKVIAVTGFGPQVGKTSTVKGLGAALAEGGSKVLIVDGDMRAASLSTLYGYSRRAGLVDVLQGAATPEQTCVRIHGSLSILPTRPSQINAASLLSGPHTADLVRHLRSEYDYVLLDSPPIAALADGLILSTLSDLVVFVARANVTRVADLRAAWSSLSQSVTPVEGMVVFEQVETQSYYPTGGAAGQRDETVAPELTPANR